MDDPNESYYRKSVLPFAGLMILASLILLPLFAFTDLPINYCPFFHDQRKQHLILTGISATQLIIGMGLAMRSRIALYAFWFHLGLGTTFLTSGLVFDPPSHMDGTDVAIASLFGVIVNGAVGVWLYTVRSAFR
jgi:hypothetical protein